VLVGMCVQQTVLFHISPRDCICPLSALQCISEAHHVRILKNMRCLENVVSQELFFLLHIHTSCIYGPYPTIRVLYAPTDNNLNLYST
jgi:hypothetical protein